MSDFLWDSPVYQEIIAEAKSKGFLKGKAEGFAEGVEAEKIRSLFRMRQELLDHVNDRFPILKELTQKCVAEIGDDSALLRLGMEISTAPTEQEVEKILRGVCLYEGWQRAHLRLASE